eukprot:TRINITY_DN1784_c0_g1_i3.p1 TRINITY_DN1784_c0_g1~~TRINITY_DN1784_c0_g1_i3.p1  ORF type:complete len:175 (-),score=28.01 TRINITY_DN1784_c0_g1_i3:315-791(-)
MAAIMSKAAACSALTSSTCSSNSDCEWKASVNKCDVNSFASVEVMLKPYVNAQVLETLRSRYKACTGLTSSTDCGAKSDCQWSADDKKCNLAASVPLSAAGGSPQLIEASVQSELCQTRSATSCTDKCEAGNKVVSSAISSLMSLPLQALVMTVPFLL